MFPNLQTIQALWRPLHFFQHHSLVSPLQSCFYLVITWLKWLLKLPVTLSPKYTDSFHTIPYACSQQHTHGGECSYFTFLVLCISPQSSLYLFGWFLVSFADSVSFYPDLILCIGVSKAGPLDRVIGCSSFCRWITVVPHICSFTFYSFHHPWSAMVWKY